MTEMTETLRLVASLVVLFTAVLQFLPRAARWIATKVRPVLLSGERAHELEPQAQAPLQSQEASRIGLLLGLALARPRRRLPHRVVLSRPGKAKSSHHLTR